VTQPRLLHPVKKALVVTFLLALLTAALGCADNPAQVRMDDEGITVYGVSISWDYIDLHWREHIPTPTHLPVPTLLPELMPVPTATVTQKSPTDLVATLSSDDWADDAILSQHYGRALSIRGVFNGFRGTRGLTWLDNGMNLF